MENPEIDFYCEQLQWLIDMKEWERQNAEIVLFDSGIPLIKQ